MINLVTLLKNIINLSVLCCLVFVPATALAQLDFLNKLNQLKGQIEKDLNTLQQANKRTVVETADGVNGSGDNNDGVIGNRAPVFSESVGNDGKASDPAAKPSNQAGRLASESSRHSTKSGLLMLDEYCKLVTENSVVGRYLALPEVDRPRSIDVDRVLVGWNNRKLDELAGKQVSTQVKFPSIAMINRDLTQTIAKCLVELVQVDRKTLFSEVEEFRHIVNGVLQLKNKGVQCQQSLDANGNRVKVCTDNSTSPELVRAVEADLNRAFSNSARGGNAEVVLALAFVGGSTAVENSGLEDRIAQIKEKKKEQALREEQERLAQAKKEEQKKLEELQKEEQRRLAVQQKEDEKKTKERAQLNEFVRAEGLLKSITNGGYQSCFSSEQKRLEAEVASIKSGLAKLVVQSQVAAETKKANEIIRLKDVIAKSVCITRAHVLVQNLVAGDFRSTPFSTSFSVLEGKQLTQAGVSQLSKGIALKQDEFLERYLSVSEDMKKIVNSDRTKSKEAKQMIIDAGNFSLRDGFDRAMIIVSSYVGGYPREFGCTQSSEDPAVAVFKCQ